MSDNTEKTLPKVYDPAEVEKRWAEYWVKSEIFTADLDSDAPSFSMVIPPPNITGTLHLGHALNNTLQDIMNRYKKLCGFNVLWLPGIDHAGIATQNVVERMLHAEGTNRHEIGREKFIERVWKWKEESGDAIVNQLKRLGASCDWSRQRFTMDEGLSRAVRKVFTELYNDKLIYRDDFIINWCPRCHTALSDLEVEADEKDGSLWYLSYPLSDGSGSLTVATTRPETMLGDVAVAVNPDDERYAEFIGKSIKLPLTDREIPILADDFVDPEFGTGAVKITPAHDFNDFEMSARHNLPHLNIMDIDAKLNEEAGPAYAGLDRYEARKKVLADLKAEGRLEKTEKYKVRLGECYRCRTVVEPRLSKQWFVKVKPLAEPAIKAVEDGQTKFVPKNWEKTYFEWMRNIRDWCISRQIWWGHRIPAWHCGDCDEITVSETDPDKCSKCSSTNIEQDPDVLDTWFSSALWPFSTLNWPEETKELQSFYPTSSLFTSFDIIFFWVARMMMMGLKFKGDVPFKEVYIHALIRDAEGQKMSKSKGNVIDPLTIMDKFGTDALRFTLAVFAAQGRDIKLAEDRIEGNRNFCNKIWNLARFTLMNLEDSGELIDVAEDNLSTADKWILTKFSECRDEVNKAIEAYEFDRAARALYSFIWHELCDWYLELIKPDLWGDNGEDKKKRTISTLAKTLKNTLIILHPFMPFITEEIYSCLPGAKESILKEEWPSDSKTYKEAAGLGKAMDVIRSVRNIKTEMNLTPGIEVVAICVTKDKQTLDELKDSSQYIERLARVTELTLKALDENDKKPEKSAFSVAAEGLIEVYVPLKGLIDVAAETKRLTKELDKIEKELGGILKKLSNESFLERAPKEIIEKENGKKEELLGKRVKIEEGLTRIKEMA